MKHILQGLKERAIKLFFKKEVEKRTFKPLLAVNLQHFAEGDDNSGNSNNDNNGTSDNANTGDSDNGGDNSGQDTDDQEQKKIDDIVKKRLERERKKLEKEWQQKLEDEKKREQMTTEERLKTEKADAEKKANEAVEAANKKIVTAEAKAAAIELGVKPEKVKYLLKLADLNDIDIDDEGEVDAKTLQAALNEVLNDMPELKGTVQSKGGGDFNNGNTALKKPLGLKDALRQKYKR